MREFLRESLALFCFVALSRFENDRHLDSRSGTSGFKGDRRVVASNGNLLRVCCFRASPARYARGHPRDRR